MKLEINGWGRSVETHRRDVIPVTKKDKYTYPAEAYGALTWFNSTTAYGKVRDLKLTGNFLFKFNFEVDELRNWLMVSAKADPEATLRLILEAQAEALIALSKQT